MTFGEYIRKKYGGSHKCLTRGEAKVMGIAYPLQKGWFEKVEHASITDQQIEALRKALEKCVRRVKKRSSLTRKTTKQYALDALSALPAAQEAKQ